MNADAEATGIREPGDPPWKGCRVKENGKDKCNHIFIFLPFTFDTEAIGRFGLNNISQSSHALFDKLSRKCRKNLSQAYAATAALSLDRIDRFAAFAWLPKSLRTLKRKENETGEHFQQRVREKNAPVWEFDETGLSKDFYPYIQQIFGYQSAPVDPRQARPVDEAGYLASTPAPQAATGNDKTPPPAPDEFILKAAELNQGMFHGLPPLVLGAEMLHMLQGSFGKAGKGMELELSPAAARRLETVPKGSAGDEKTPAKPCLPVRIEGARIQLFGSGHGLLVFDLQCSKPDDSETLTMEMVLEACYVLSRNPRHYKQLHMQWREPGDAEQCPSLIDLADALLPLKYVTAGYPEQSRFFTYSYVQIDEDLPKVALDDYGLRLGCRFTEDYHAQPPDNIATQYSPFDGMTHTMTSEGGSLVLTTGRRVGFLKNFGRDPLKRAYLPLAMLAYHESNCLLSISQEMLAYDIYQAISAKDLRDAKKLHAKLVQFHLQFRFSVPSIIAMHNRTHAAWRTALKLDRLLDEAVRDVGEAEKLLREDESLRHERKIRRWEAIIAGFGAGYFLWQIASAYIAYVYKNNPAVVLQGLNLAGTAHTQAIKQIVLHNLTAKKHCAVFLGELSILGGILAGCISYFWRSRGPN